MVNSVNQNYYGGTHCCIRPEKFDGTNFKPGLRPLVNKPENTAKAKEAYPGEKQELEEKLVKMLKIMQDGWEMAKKRANGKFVTVNFGPQFEQEVLRISQRLNALNGVEKPKFPEIIY